MMLQKIYILNKFCSFELSKKYKLKKKCKQHIFNIDNNKKGYLSTKSAY